VKAATKGSLQDRGGPDAAAAATVLCAMLLLLLLFLISYWHQQHSKSQECKENAVDNLANKVNPK
jgi:uncharacterized membrane protein affecting hemolysin expression